MIIDRYDRSKEGGEGEGGGGGVCGSQGAVRKTRCAVMF